MPKCVQSLWIVCVQGCERIVGRTNNVFTGWVGFPHQKQFAFCVLQDPATPTPLSFHDLYAGRLGFIPEASGGYPRLPQALLLPLLFVYKLIINTIWLRQSQVKNA